MTDWTADEERVGAAVLAELSDRKGFRHLLGDIDDEVMGEIRGSVGRAAIAAMSSWRDVATDPPPPNVSLLLFEPETPGRAGAIVVGMARWGWDNEVARNWSENPWATHWMPLPPAPEPKP